MTMDSTEDYFKNHLKEYEFIMIQDMMRAIQVTENEEFVRTFSDENAGFMFSQNSRVDQISKNIQLYKDHSGSSFAFTCRCCQYLLQNTDIWKELQQKFIIE